MQFNKGFDTSRIRTLYLRRKKIAHDLNVNYATPRKYIDRLYIMGIWKLQGADKTINSLIIY